MTAHLGKNRRPGAYPKWASCGNGHVMLALVAGALQQPRHPLAAEVTWQPQTASTSSRTRCRRKTRGRSATSKWQMSASRTISRRLCTWSAR